MAVELKFLDENNQDFDMATGVDFGLTRKGIASIKKFKIKNIGDLTARELIVTGATLNEREEVTEEEYQDQLKAATWKTFCLEEKGVYSKELSLGNVLPSKFVEGEKTTEISFFTEKDSILKDVWTAGVTEFRTDRHIFKKLDGGSKGQVAKRMNIPTMPSCRDLEVELNIDFNCTVEEEESSQPFIGFPVRINSKGDGKGYMFIMHYRRKDKKYMVSIYKNAKGMVSNVDRDYGTKIFDTILWQTYDKSKKMTFKVYNNTLGQPTFEVKYDGKNVKLGKAYVSGVQGMALSDTSTDAYKDGGAYYKDISLYDGDFYCATSNMKIKTEELEQFIYVKTIIGNEAENKVTYKSSAMVSYLED